MNFKSKHITNLKSQLQICAVIVWKMCYSLDQLSIVRSYIHTTMRQGETRRSSFYCHYPLTIPLPIYHPVQNSKGQLNSEWIHFFIVSPKMQTKNYKDFCPTIQTRIVALFFGDFLVSVGTCFFGMAEIWNIFGWHFGRNDDLINSFWN